MGISRFFLVLFYNNWDRCRGAMNTVLTNRLGDYFLFIFMCGFWFSGLRFLRLILRFGLGLGVLVLAGFTKRAQFPFRSWLPKAMSAPTPVSSLVHRRTLVTAGLVLVLNFCLGLGNRFVSMVMVVGGLLTMVFSRLAALVEEDLKKVVALRTLSQIGFSFLAVGVGVGFVALLHLLRHALFKRCLFMQVGYIIHRLGGQQDGRGYGGLVGLSVLVQLQLLVTLFCLCGLLVSRGAGSKDWGLE